MNEFVCKLCNKQFDYKSKLDEHLNRKKLCDNTYNKDENLIGKFKCELCDKTFTRNSTLNNHI